MATKISVSEMQEIVKMLAVELRSAVPASAPVAEVAVKSAAVETGDWIDTVLKSARWLRDASAYFKGKATHVVVADYGGSTYYHLADSKGNRIGEKNRQMRRRKNTANDWYSIPFGRQPLNGKLYKL
jgi:hypothetical protein